MAIKGLTDRKTLKPRLPRLGKLRKGGEKSSKNKPGPDLDHFRFTSDNPEIEAAFYAAYNAQPRVINVVMFNPTAEENFATWIEAWDASGMVFRSDGETCHIWRDGSNYKRGRKPHIDHPDQFEVGRLEVVIPELLQAGFVGTVTLETHSNHDLRNIASVLFAAEQERDGNLRGAQFILRRVEREISTPGWGDRANQRSKTKKWLVELEAPTRMFGGLLTSGNAAPMIEATTGEVIDDDEPRQLPQAQYHAPATNGKPQHPPRPMEPEKTRQFIASLVTYKRSKNADGTQILTDPDAPASQAARGLFVGKLTEVFAPNDDAEKMRRSVIGYLFGVESSTELTKAEVSAGLDWLIDHKTDEGDYIINAFAIDEARVIERQVLLDAGQQEMKL